LALAALVVAALLIPDFVEPRISRNEKTALRGVQLLKTAQDAYRHEAGGFAPALACLSRPHECLPAYRGAAFIDEAYAGGRKGGYIYELVAEPRESRSVADRYAVFANPGQPGETGIRSFCADSAGRFCFSLRALRPVSDSAACPATCAQEIR
jgi:hypothetical protein